MICPNCGDKAISSVRRVVVSAQKVKTDLCHCASCDYLFLPDPSWLPSAYQQEFYADTGYVARNLDMAKKSLALFRCWKLISGEKSFPLACDIGAGLGMYARMMRDHGYPFHGSDEYARMPLIQPFVSNNSWSTIKTAFEVVEHLPCLPLFLSDQVKEVDLFLFSTEIRRTGDIPDEEWWYYAFAIGQHIAFHSRKSLSHAFARAGYSSSHLFSHGSSLHALAVTKQWQKAFRFSRKIWMLQRHLDSVSRYFAKYCFAESSLIASDHLRALDLGSN